MKTKKLIVFLIGILPFFSCSEKNSVEFEVFLEGQLVKRDVNKGIWPKYMFDDNIYALDNDWSFCVGKLTKTEWQKAKKVFTKGHGQNEFGIMCVSQDRNGALYILDHPFEDNMGSLSLISLTKIQKTDDIAAMKDPNNWEKYDLSKMTSFYMGGNRFEVLTDSTLLVVGTSDSDPHHIFSIVNYKNQTFTPLDYWPNDSTPEALNGEKLMAYTAYCGLIGNGKGRFLYWIENKGKFAFIFTVGGTKTNILSQLYDDTIQISGKPKLPIERIHCCADNNRIYVLQKTLNSKGEKMEQLDMKDPFPYGNTVEVYDWDGVKQQIIHLDHLGQEIMLSKDGKTLFLDSGYNQDGSDPYMYSYDLTARSTKSAANTLQANKSETDTIHILQIGEKAVDGEFFDLQGNKHRLYDAFADGRYVLLDFWGVNCGACIKSESELDEVYKRVKGKLEIVGINLDSVSVWQRNKRSQQMAWSNWSDGKMFKGEFRNHYYDYNAYPFFVLLAPDGRILWELSGYVPGGFLALADVINGPQQDNSATLNLAVTKVDASSSGTKVRFRIYTLKGLGFTIAPDSYLSANGKKYKVTAAEGIKLGENVIPEVKAFTVTKKFGLYINYCDFTLTFEPFEAIPESFDFKAGDGDDVFVIRNIRSF